MQKITVYEFSDWFAINKRNLLQTHLEQVWEKRFFRMLPSTDIEEDDKALKKSYQPFLNFDGEKAKCNNYVGFIQSEELSIEIHPKVFKSFPINEKNNQLMLKHLFFWFDYCRKWRLPFSDVNLNQDEQLNLPELIIKLIANQFYDAIAEQPLSLYTSVEESLTIPRGRINFSRYINENFSRGQQHVLACDHELLLFDNTFNQVIKYTTRFLKNKAKFSETQRKLDEILFLLDEVSDVYCTSEQLDRVSFNSFFSDYSIVKDLCKMVLDQQLYSHEQDEQNHWSLLFPMEYVFEDFIAGFLEKHFSHEWKATYQKSEKYLINEPYKAFRMQHDIFLENINHPDIKIIVDTKYKLRGEFKDDPKRGVAQSDLYQMTSYAFSRGCSNILLLYPNQKEELWDSDTFIISSGFDSSQKVKVVAAEIPFWSINGYSEIEVPLIKKLKELLNVF
jgi:5-methylcytosine-specific restriction enzyme subunit McrC